MKTKSILTFLALFLTLALFAQGGAKQEKRDQIKSLKVAFITEALDLSPTEAQKFWPIYNQFDDRQFELRRQKMDTYKKRIDESIDKMTDKEAALILSQMETSENELHQLRKDLVQDLRGIISPLKILKLKKAEEDFNRKLLRQYRDRKK